MVSAVTTGKQVASGERRPPSHAKLLEAVSRMLEQIARAGYHKGRGTISFPIHQGGVGTIETSVTEITTTD